MTEKSWSDLSQELRRSRTQHALAIVAAGSIPEALAAGGLPRFIDTTVSEALVLGLCEQGVRKFVTVFGHGTTEIGEVLRIYQQAGLVQVFNVRSELEASHAATALRWVTGEKAAVITSIGPGALQALAASLVPASDGVGVWYLLGDETTEDEGPNMQQIPRHEQALFLKLFSQMGQAYSLHTPGALSTALRRGSKTVDQPERGAPFYLLLPMNVQPLRMDHFNLDELLVGAPPPLGAAAYDGAYDRTVEALLRAKRILIRLGGGARRAREEILELLELVDAVAIQAPVALGVVPYHHPRNMTVGGSKGSLCGNYAMENADLVIVVGSRAVCQADCSRTGFLRAEQVININADLEAALHYGKTIPLVGEAGATLRKLVETLKKQGVKPRSQGSTWLAECKQQRRAWTEFKEQRYHKRPYSIQPGIEKC